MMRPVRSRESAPQGGASGLPARLGALRASESRIRALQKLRPCRGPEGALPLPGPLHTAPLHTAVDTALRTARACAAEGDFQQAGPASLAAMANNFSKMCNDPVSHEIDAILACIGQEVGRRASAGALAGWSARHLSMVTNGLAKGQGAWVEQVLVQLAQALLDLSPGQLRERWRGNAQSLAMMVNGLSKAEDDRILAALDQLAQALPEVQHLRLESGWNACHLAMMASGLARAEGGSVQQARSRLAQVTMARDLASRQGWTAQRLAMMANGLAKSEGDSIMEALGHLSRELLRRPHLTPEEGWSARPLAMMASALAKGEAACIREALEHLARALLKRPDLRPEEGWSAQPLAMMANALGKGEGAWSGEALVHLARALLVRGPLVPAQGWTPRRLAMMAGGLVKGKGACINEALTHLARALLAAKSLTPASGWSTQPLAMMANGLAGGEGLVVQQALTRLAQAIRGQELTEPDGWSASFLAMMANGLSKGEGPEVQEALTGLAQAIQGQELTEHNGWSTQCLVLMANGLGKGQGPVVRSALTCVARAVVKRQLAKGAGWEGRQLAMMTHALAKGEGPDIQQALAHIATRICQLPRAVIQDWPVQPQAMMLHGLARGEGPDIQAALDRLAQAVVAAGPRLEQGWHSRFLAMAASGLARASGMAARQALDRLADLVCQLDLADCPGVCGRALAIIMDAMGQTLADHAAFAKITAALVQQARLEPGVVHGYLCCLSRFALSEAQLRSASRLLEALRGSDFRPASQREWGEMLWSITLCHFASVQLASVQRSVDNKLALSFAQAWHDWFGTGSGCRADKSAAAGGDHWHDSWAADYWQRPATARRPLPVVPAAGVHTESAPVLSYRQNQIFTQLRTAMPGHDVRQEVQINQFPVDILIDGRVCVEVDGPVHFVEILVDTGEPTGRVLVRQRRTRDLFVDHMLRQYGYRVFRIDVSQSRDLALLDERVGQLVMALDALPAQVAGAGQQEPQAAQEPG